MSYRGWRRGGRGIDKPRMKEVAGVHNIKKGSLKYEAVQRENWFHDIRVCYLRLQYFLSICESIVSTLSFINPDEDVSYRSRWLRLLRTLILMFKYWTRGIQPRLEHSLVVFLYCPLTVEILGYSDLPTALLALLMRINKRLKCRAVTEI